MFAYFTIVKVRSFKKIAFLFIYIIFITIILSLLVNKVLLANNYKFELVNETSKCYVFKYHGCLFLVRKTDFNKHLEIGNYYYLQGRVNKINTNIIFYHKYKYFLYIKRWKFSNHGMFYYFEKIKNIFSKRLHNDLTLCSLTLGKKNINYLKNLNILNASYLFCISGIHVNSLKKIVKPFKGIRFLGIPFGMFWIFYLLLLNLSIPLLRAVIFLFISKLKKYWNYLDKFSVYDILIFTAFIIFVSNPDSIFSLTFIYSFLYTFLIAWYHEHIFIKRKIKKIFYFIIYIQIINFILSIWINKYISINSFFTLIFLALIIELLFIGSFFILIIPWLYIIFKPLINIFNQSIIYLTQHNILINISFPIFIIIILLFIIVIYLKYLWKVKLYFKKIYYL